MVYLMSNISKDEKTGCWNWTGQVFKGGYGVFKCISVKKGPMNASRASWIVQNGPIASTKIKVCHTCDNRLCVNLDHLFLGSMKENMEDCVSKDRMNKGSDRPQSKLDEDKVAELKKLHAEGWSYRQLGELYGVSSSVCHRADKGTTWRHVA